jgi:hypothetical protein
MRDAGYTSRDEADWCFLKRIDYVSQSGYVLQTPGRRHGRRATDPLDFPPHFQP